MRNPTAVPNPDLVVGQANKTRWTHADHRRRGFHNLYRIARYGLSLRAAHVMRLEKRMDLRIADLASIHTITSLPWFSAMVVIRGAHVLFERYAPDFSSDAPHSIQSITKTTMNLMVGQLVESGVLDLSRPIKYYLPEIGTGYANATVQQVLNMDVVNDYSEDFTDPSATYYKHEEAMGWRLPEDMTNEKTQRQFLTEITSRDITNDTSIAQYKDANTDVLGWVCERASGQPLRSFLCDIVDASGIEGAFHISTDREGFPTLDGGACLTARDLARYLSIFVRLGRGVTGDRVGSEAFIERTLSSGVPMAPPYDGLLYSNQMMISGRTLGHAGWGGQYAMANLDTGTIAVFFSVIENEHAINLHYLRPVIRALDSIVNLSPEEPP